jgi:hypothetical protein
VLIRVVALVQHLSNDQFGHTIMKLTRMSQTIDEHGGPDGGQVVDVKASGACVCGCGGLVNTPRKFVNQEHYNGWMRQRRYWGRNLPRSG